MLDYTINEISNARFKAMLHEAEVERRAHQVQQNRLPRTGSSFLVQVGNWMIESGSWLKQQNEMRPGLS